VHTERLFCRNQHCHTADLAQRTGQVVFSKHEASSDVFNAHDSSVIYDIINVLSIHKTIVENNIAFFLECFSLTTAILKSVMSPGDVY
jgi:hypothetical protein